MKKRIGFVSNSSSSSFICDVTGEKYEGYDLSPCDEDLYECEEGHIFPMDMKVRELTDEEAEDYCEVPKDVCPICMKVKPYYPTNGRLLSYMLDKLNMNYDTIRDEFKALELTDAYVEKYK